MSRQLAGAVALLVFAAGAAGAPAGPAQRLDRLLARTHTLTAQFTERVENANAATVKHAEGTVAISKPGRFRWDYEKPYRELIIADGKRLWVYDPDLEQVTVRPEPQALAAGPAQLLAGSGKVEDQFEVSEGGTAGGLEWLRLVPRAHDSDYTAIRLGFDRAGNIRVMELASKLGQTTHLAFSDVRRNVALPAARFRFTPPPGVDVVHQAPAGATPPASAATGGR